MKGCEQATAWNRRIITGVVMMAVREGRDPRLDELPVSVADVLPLNPGAYGWELDATADHEPEDIFELGAAAMLGSIVAMLDVGPGGLKALEERVYSHLEGDPEGRKLFMHFEESIWWVYCHVAVIVVPLLAEHRATISKGPHYWREQRALYVEALELARVNGCRLESSADSDAGPVDPGIER